MHVFTGRKRRIISPQFSTCLLCWDSLRLQLGFNRIENALEDIPQTTISLSKPISLG